MYLTDHPVLNLLRRLRGWTRSDARLMVEAKDEAGKHFFCVYECRGATRTEGEAALEDALAREGARLVEIADEQQATVPAPRHVAVIRLSERVYFGDMPPGTPLGTRAGVAQK